MPHAVDAAVAFFDPSVGIKTDRVKGARLRAFSAADADLLVCKDQPTLPCKAADGTDLHAARLCAVHTAVHFP